MSYTLGEAAKATGMSKAALSRAIKNGKLSAEKLDGGSFKIDPAELHRVYPPVATKHALEQERATVSNPDLNAENRELKIKLEGALQRLTEHATQIEDLREDRDQWREQAQRLAITDQRTQQVTQHAPEPQRRSWWRFGKG